MAVATGIYWNKLVPGGSNVNSTSSTALTDMGGGATFFDNLVEVRRLPERVELTGIPPRDPPAVHRECLLATSIVGLSTVRPAFSRTLNFLGM